MTDGEEIPGTLEQRSCVWSWMDPGQSDSAYETACGKAYMTLDGTLEENELKYCPFCGGLIEPPAPYDPETEDED